MGIFIASFYEIVIQFKLKCISRTLRIVPNTEVSKQFSINEGPDNKYFQLVGHVVSAWLLSSASVVCKQL